MKKKVDTVKEPVSKKKIAPSKKVTVKKEKGSKVVTKEQPVKFRRVVKFKKEIIAISEGVLNE